MNDGIREAADRVERVAPLDRPTWARKRRRTGETAALWRAVTLADVCDDLHVQQCDVVAELVRRREARLGARQ